MTTEYGGALSLLDGPNGMKVPRKVLERSPVKELHSDWYFWSAEQRKNLDVEYKKFQLSNYVLLLMTLPKCLDSWKPLTRACSCSCLHDSGLSEGCPEMKSFLDFMIPY